MDSLVRQSLPSPHAADFGHVEHWVFDLDNTLYPPECDLFAQIDAKMCDFIMGLLEVDAIEARRVQKDFYVDLDNRLRKLEPQKATVDGKEVMIAPQEQRDYDAALAYFKSGDYRNAGASFYDFTRRYPESGLTPSAQYWLGNTYYAQRDYKNAISAQQVVVKNYPDSPKAADALLNIASCYIELKDKAAAKRTLETLVAKYPDSPSAQTAKDRLAALK